MTRRLSDALGIAILALTWPPYFLAVGLGPWLAHEWRLWRTGSGTAAPPARWLRIVRPVAYVGEDKSGRPLPGVISPGLVGECYLTLCVGRGAVEALIARGDVLVTTETYRAKPVALPFYRFAWPA